MTIQKKLFLPMIGVIIIMGGFGGYFIDWQLTALKKEYTRKIARARVRDIEKNIEFAGQKALETASLFARLPAVYHAFEVAHSGNIEDADNEKGQQAREMLRTALKPMLDGYAAFNGGARLKLHFHLPNGRSLARLWRNKQIRKDGQWQDLSDDISGFRHTVNDVNRTGRPVQGIELGRGGFVVRGVVPVISDASQQLGSAEVLIDFAPLLKDFRQGDNIFLFMNAQYLSVTHRLQDKEKYPVTGKRYVQVFGSHSADAQVLTAEFIDSGRKEISIRFLDEKAAIVFPVRDYKGGQIGVIGFLHDISGEKKITRTVTWILIGLLLLILLTAGAFSTFILSVTVLKPVKRIRRFSDRFSQGDFTYRLQEHHNDEMGRLALSLNRMGDNIQRMFKEIGSSVETLGASAEDIVNSVEDQASVSAQQSASVSEITATMSELLASSAQIAEHADSVAEIAQNALDVAREGAASVEAVTQQMNEITVTHQHVIREIGELGEKAGEIMKVMEIINHIADQTKLIAFNAAIEASSAGDAGKRFGVVASEIRRLADDVMASTIDIEDKLNEVQKAVNHMIIDSESSSKMIRKGLSHSTRTHEELTQIVEGARATADAAKEISLSTRQQKTASEQVVSALKEIDDAAKQTTDAIGQLNLVSRDLNGLSNQLTLLISQFSFENPDRVSETDQPDQTKIQM